MSAEDNVNSCSLRHSLNSLLRPTCRRPVLCIHPPPCSKGASARHQLLLQDVPLRSASRLAQVRGGRPRWDVNKEAMLTSQMREDQSEGRISNPNKPLPATPSLASLPSCLAWLTSTAPVKQMPAKAVVPDYSIPPTHPLPPGRPAAPRLQQQAGHARNSRPSSRRICQGGGGERRARAPLLPARLDRRRQLHSAQVPPTGRLHAACRWVGSRTGSLKNAAESLPLRGMPPLSENSMGGACLHPGLVKHEQAACWKQLA